MTARKSKSAPKTKGGAALKLRRRGRGKEEEEEEVESSEGDNSIHERVGDSGQMYSTLYSPTPVLPHHTTPPPPNLPLTPNTSLLDLTVTYDYRASAVGEGPDKSIEELSAMFAFKVHSIYGSGTGNTVRMRSVGLQSIAWQGLVLGFMHSCVCTQDSPVGRVSVRVYALLPVHTGQSCWSAIPSASLFRPGLFPTAPCQETPSHDPPSVHSLSTAAEQVPASGVASRPTTPEAQ